MVYSLRYSKSFTKKFKTLSVADRRRMHEAMRKLSEDPYPKGKSMKRLKGIKDEFLRLRVGDFRVLYIVRGEYVDILDLVPRGELEKAIKRL